jgi:hypothetical protein
MSFATGDYIRRPNFTLYFISLPLQEALDGIIKIGLGNGR